jgi:hypothetical protein
MSAQPNYAPRFVRKTQLATNEYHKNFYKLDREIIASITSAEADKVTPLMSKIYLRLINAPDRYWEREGVLRFEAESREGKQIKAWDVFCEVAGVASATANKAITWLHRQGIIGYFAGKNGVGLRIFLNRASASIGVRAAPAGQKILRFAPASSGESHASQDEAAFSDSFADPEVLDTDYDPRAPKNGAAEPKTLAGKEIYDLSDAPSSLRQSFIRSSPHNRPSYDSTNRSDNDDELIERLAREIVPHVRAATTREHERTREWFITHALPKAIRVSQRSAYDVLRAHGVITESRGGKKSVGLDVGKNIPATAAEQLNDDDVISLAQSCVTLLETRGQAIECTLAEMGVESGGFLLPADAPRVRAKAEALLGGGEGSEVRD